MWKDQFINKKNVGSLTSGFENSFVFSLDQVFNHEISAAGEVWRAWRNNLTHHRKFLALFKFCNVKLDFHPFDFTWSKYEKEKVFISWSISAPSIPCRIHSQQSVEFSNLTMDLYSLPTLHLFCRIPHLSVSCLPQAHPLHCSCWCDASMSDIFWYCTFSACLFSCCIFYLPTTETCFFMSKGGTLSWTSVPIPSITDSEPYKVMRLTT